ncbi:MAG: T9SS type A sorting domain-containing protein [Cyanobacteria bacterium J06607_17]
MFRSVCLGVSMVCSLGWGLRAYGQSLPQGVADSLEQLDRAICLRQWDRAIDITSGLIASSDVSTGYRQELLGFRRQLQLWQTSSLSPTVQASCDRTLSLFITLDEPEAPEPQPLDWARALATLGNTRPIIQLDDGIEPANDIIPVELTANSPELLTDLAIPIDTTDGFNVIGGSVNGYQQTYSFLARMGDRISLALDVTRTHTQGDAQLFVFDQTGRLVSQRDPGTLQTQDVAVHKTGVYFAVVSPQDVIPVLDPGGLITDWQIAGGTSFDYTLTLTGVTPYQTLLP